MKKLPGFGDQKARIFLALLGKQLGVRPEGWEAASAPYGEEGSLRSVADIVDSDTLDKVRAAKQAAKQAAKAGRRERTEKGWHKKAATRKVAAKKVGTEDHKKVAAEVRPEVRTGQVVTGWDMAQRRLYLCTPDRDDSSRFVPSASGAASTSSSLREKQADDATHRRAIEAPRRGLQ